MSQVKYLVFEESNNVLNMDKISVFKNGSEMPWTYYQADILVNTNESGLAQNEGRKRFMYTSESKPGPNGEKAGEYASEIKRWIKFGNANTYSEQVIKNPTVSDYKSWGWNLSSDPNTGKEILPKYGEFTFRPGYEPSYEDVSDIKVQFKFGFGLNNTCYNFATEEVDVSIYNLSSAPQIFCSNDKYCNIAYDAALGKWGGDLVEENNNSITCSAEEGTPGVDNDKYTYLFIAVEAGEQLCVEFNDYGLDSSKNQIELFEEENNAIRSEENTGLGILTIPYRTNVEGEKNVSIAGGIKYDFYRIRINAKSDFQSLKYNSDDLNIKLKLTPVTYGTKLTGFQKIVKVNLKLTKNDSEPYIRYTTEAAQGFDSGLSGFNTQTARRSRVIVSAKEAINYGIKNNSGPSFLRGKSVDQAIEFYKNSLLTETEKNLDEYKESFKTEEGRINLAHFVTTDLSSMIVNQLTKNSGETGANALQKDISDILTNSEVINAYNQFKTDHGSTHTSKDMPLSKVYENSVRANKFQSVVNLFKVIETQTQENTNDTIEPELSYKPWTDSNFNLQRKLGSIHDASESTYSSTHDNTSLLGNKSTMLTLLYAINNFKMNGSDELINKYISSINAQQGNNSVSSGTFIDRLEIAMSNEYHGITHNAALSSHSKNRPTGLFEELYQFRRIINPVEGNSAIKYITQIMEIHDISGTDEYYYGTESIYNKQGRDTKQVKKADAERLLYNGDLSGSIFTTDGLLDATVFGSGLSITGEIFKTNVANKNAVFYQPVDVSDSNEGFLGHFVGSDAYQFARNTLANLDDVSNNDLKGKWVLTKTGSLTKPYSTSEWFTESCDLSGIIRLPGSINGCYYDIYVDGHEIAETMIDVETVASDRHTQYGSASTTFDLSRSFVEYNTTDESANYYLSDAIKNSRKFELRDQTIKFRTVNVGLYEFYRIGEIVHFFANSDNIDAEGNPAMKFPSFKIAERGDITGKCQITYSDAYVPLNDVESTLEPKVNIHRSGTTVETTETPNTSAGGWQIDASGIQVSRWATTHVPIDISGGLEQGETFQISLTDDVWFGENIEYSSSTTNHKTFSTMFTDLSQDIPIGCEDQKLYIEYKNANDVNDLWKSAKGVNFEYECHNKAKTVNAGSPYNTFGGDEHTYNNSSNVKGMPEFRVVLPVQSKLLSLYNNTSASSTSFENAFGTLGRFANIHLKYTKSGKLNTDGSVDEDGNDKLTSIRFVVSSDDYNAKISTNLITYDYITGVQTIASKVDIRTSSNNITYTTGYASTKIQKLVGPSVQNGSNDEQVIPDYTKEKVYDFDVDFLDLDGNNKRLVDYREVTFRENNNSASKPIAQINIANFLQENGEYGANAHIAPIFRFAEDEKDFDSQGVYCLLDNNTTPDGNTDGTIDCPRLIPANKNYSIYFTDDNTKIWLYRNKNLNYEDWVGGSGAIYTKNNFYDTTADASGAYREVVHVKIVYANPSATETIGTQGERNEASIIFFVKPTDVQELSYPSDFHFTVQEGDASVDISPILSASMEGVTNGNIEYFIRGIIDESGVSHFFNDTSDQAVNRLANFMDASDVSYNSTDTDTSTSSGLRLNPTDSSTDLGALTNRHINLSDLIVNNKLTIYHMNHNVAPSNVNENNKFDAYDKQFYKFYVEAKYNVQDQSNVENTLSLVTIEVENKGTDFYLADNTNWYHNVVETLGTVAEGKGRLGNNPEIPLSTFLDNLRHEDIGSGTTLYSQDNVTFRVAGIDPALEVVSPDANSTTFKEQIIRLKDINDNKTTETATQPSLALAAYVHYNYERQSEYQVTIEVCLSNFNEIVVEKTPENYICGLGETGSINSFANRTGADQNKTATYLVKSTENVDVFGANGPEDFTNNGKLYYFKDPETGLYQGPLSILPQNTSDLNNRVKIHTVNVQHAFARYETAASGYVAFYKTKGFKSNASKPPKPTDICLQPFSIKVLNSFDKPKVSPQPYLLSSDKTVGYRRADPDSQLVIDSADMTATEGKPHVSYVFTDHKEFDQHNRKDVANEFKIPEWSPEHTSTSAVGYQETDNDTTQQTREIHTFAKMNTTNTGYNNGLYNGTFDQSAQGSFEFGKFDETNADDIVVLDYIVEYHDRIDASGHNSIYTGKTPFGTEIDYSGTNMYKQYNPTTGTFVNTADSEKRIWKLTNIDRSREHLESDTSDCYYASAELEMTISGVNAGEAGESYSFSIVAVSNALATDNDLSFNKNMVDWNQAFYPKVSEKPSGTALSNPSEAEKYPQPFQKYAYDASSNKIVTYGYSNNNSDTAAKADSVGTNVTHNTVHSNNKGVLLCCRTHFNVCIQEDNGSLATTITATSNNWQASRTITGSGALQFAGGVTKAVVADDGQILPLQTVTGNTSDIRLFDIGNGQVVMGMYQNKKWESLQH